jgi:hypothetical protein
MATSGKMTRNSQVPLTSILMPSASVTRSKRGGVMVMAIPEKTQY